MMNSSPSLQELAKELYQRQAAKESLRAYIDLVMPGLEFAKHHLLMIEKLEALARREINKLALFLPPGSAKSIYSSILFPPWFLGREPKNSVIAVSHTAELAERFGRRARNIAGSNEHRLVFGTSIDEQSAAAGRWETTEAGEYYAAGVGGSVTGRRGGLAVIDDPVRGREDADSERAQESAWQWYLNDLLTRLKPNALQLLVMTRWHESDLGGRILEREASQWEIIKLPMLADKDDALGRAEGEMLWPEYFTPAMVEIAKQDPRSWNSLYQQDPIPEGGDYFKSEWVVEYDTPPATMNIYGASDYAVTDGAGDYTEHGVFGVDVQGNIYVLDWWRGRTTPDVWIDAKCALMNKWRPLCWFGESGVIRRSLEPSIVKRMTERRIFCRLEFLASIADKVARARSIQNRMAMGKVWWPKRASWRSEVIGQVLKFPAGKHDDAVDVLSLIGRGLEFIRYAAPANDEDQVYVANGWMG